MTRDFRDYVSDIDKAIVNIETFIAGMTYEEFVRDEKTIWAVIRGFEVIGEAVKSLPEEMKTKHQNIPWKEMAAMRNKLIHEYFGVDVRVLWKTAKEDIPSVKPSIEEILNTLS
jgi:uncharacterized protein with HEPN domain